MDENQAIECPIWGTRAELLEGEPEGNAQVLSWRAGGAYLIDADVRKDVANLFEDEKAKLTTWLFEQRRLGVEYPLVNREAVTEALRRRRLRFSEKRDRFFQALSAMEWGPGSVRSITVYEQNDKIGFLRLCHIASFIDAETLEEARGMVELLSADGFVRLDGTRMAVTSKGLDKVEELETSGANTAQAFVAMWFGDEMNEPWRLGFAPGIRDAGYVPFRIDGKEHNNKIDDEIVAEIKRSRFLIADFTCGAVTVKGKSVAIPRGGVYYEAGLAHGLGMEVIFACRADRINELHFDTRQFAHIVWNDPADLRTKLYNRIAATLGEAPGAPGRGQGSVDPAPGGPKPKVVIV